MTDLYKTKPCAIRSLPRTFPRGDFIVKDALSDLIEVLCPPSRQRLNSFFICLPQRFLFLVAFLSEKHGLFFVEERLTKKVFLATALFSLLNIYGF